MNYNYKKFKVQLDIPIKADVKVESDATIKNVDDERKITIQASIVRIMKTRNIMSHLQLIEETIKQVSKYFNPNVKMIKPCIDLLIDKDYMKRVEGKRDEYAYVA
jgi:cullin 1